MKNFAAQLQRREQQHLYRRRKTIDSPQGVEIRYNGQQTLSFCSNDYLGLANHPRLIHAFKKAADEYGVGSGSAHLITGHLRPHEILEEKLAEFFNRPRALVFSTGYMANLGILSALTDRHDVIFEDKLNHASLLDGAQLSRAALKRYHHLDCDHLESLLQESRNQHSIIATDALFSMDGDLAPLPRLAQLAAQYQSLLMIDDAHGIGVLGETGRGCVEYFGLNDHQVPILMGTMGKALGTFGAFVAASEDIIEMLIQDARSYLFTTAPPPAIAAATIESLAIIDDEPWRRAQLQERIEQFRKGAKQLGLALMESHSAIQPIVFWEAQAAVTASEKLLAQKILVPAIRPPTVPQGSARIRITLCANHTTHQVNQLLEGLASL